MESWDLLLSLSFLACGGMATLSPSVVFCALSLFRCVCVVVVCPSV